MLIKNVDIKFFFMLLPLLEDPPETRRVAIIGSFVNGQVTRVVFSAENLVHASYILFCQSKDFVYDLGLAVGVAFTDRAHEFELV